MAPLLINDQVASLKRKGIAANCIGPECSQEDIKAIQNGHYSLGSWQPGGAFGTGTEIYLEEKLGTYLEPSSSTRFITSDEKW